MGGENVLFLFFKFLGYQKMGNLKCKAKKEIVFISFTMGLVALRFVLSLKGLNSGNTDAMTFSLFMNLIPVMQTVLTLLRKVSELERKRNKSFKGIFRATNTVPRANPFLSRLFILAVFLSVTLIAPALYLFRFSSDNTVAAFLLELVVWMYMIFSAADGIFEQLIVLFSVEV